MQSHPKSRGRAQAAKALQKILDVLQSLPEFRTTVGFRFRENDGDDNDWYSIDCEWNGGQCVFTIAPQFTGENYIWNESYANRIEIDDPDFSNKIQPGIKKGFADAAAKPKQFDRGRIVVRYGMN